MLLFISPICNAALGALAVIALFIWIARRIVLYTRESIKEEGSSKGAYMGILALLEAAVLLIFVYDTFPKFLAFVFRNTMEMPAFRWIAIYIVAIPWSYFATRKNSGLRGVFSVFIILTIIFLG